MATSAYGWSNFQSLTLNGSIGTTDTTIAVSDASGLPNEGHGVIEPSSAANREIIYWTSKSSNNLILPSVGAGRGQGGTSAMAHSSGVTFKQNTVAEMFEVLQDGSGWANDLVKSRHIDWADTGSGDEGGIWWEEIGKTTLTVAADTISVSSLSARTYLKILVKLIDTGGTLNANVTFNGDTGNNYARRSSVDGAADGTATSGANFTISPSLGATRKYGELLVFNDATRDKIVIGSISQWATGAGGAPSRMELFAQWANTADAISSITITNTGTGDYAIGSELRILGHN